MSNEFKKNLEAAAQAIMDAMSEIDQPTDEYVHLSTALDHVCEVAGPELRLKVQMYFIGEVA
jgi:hypothetical protein